MVRCFIPHHQRGPSQPDSIKTLKQGHCLFSDSRCACLGYTAICQGVRAHLWNVQSLLPDACRQQHLEHPIPEVLQHSTLLLLLHAAHQQLQVSIIAEAAASSSLGNSERCVCQLAGALGLADKWPAGSNSKHTYTRTSSSLQPKGTICVGQPHTHSHAHMWWMQGDKCTRLSSMCC